MVKILKDECGATVVEYSVMLALIAAICVGIIKLVGQHTSDLFSSSLIGW